MTRFACVIASVTSAVCLFASTSAKATPPLTSKWQALANAPKVQGKQDDLFFIDENVGWSVNGKGQIFHTTDGGASWQKLVDQPGTYFRAVLFTDALHGFVGNIGTGYFPGVTDARPLFRTEDGGKTWSEVKEIAGPKPVGICNFTMVDKQHLFATGRVGGPSFFLRSSDGGKTWTSKELTAQMPMLIDAHFASAREGVLVGASSAGEDSQTRILRTTDGGETFTVAFENHAKQGEMGWKLSFPSARVGYASVMAFGGGAASVVKTTDGGVSWKVLPVAKEPFEGLGIGFIDDNVGWLGGHAKGRSGYRTVDGGKSWQPDASLGAAVNRFRFVGHAGYAIGAAIQKLSP